MALIFLFIATASVLVVPYFFGQIIGAITNDDYDAMMRNIWYMVGFTVVGGIAVLLRALGFVLAGQRLGARLRIDFYRVLLKQDVAFYDREKVGGRDNGHPHATQPPGLARPPLWRSRHRNKRRPSCSPPGPPQGRPGAQRSRTSAEQV